MTIIGPDNRTEITNFNEYPFDLVVAVDSVENGDVDFGNGVDAAEGSGILISPDHILTAAHVIHNRKAARITLAKDVPDLPPTRATKPLFLNDTNASKSNGGALSTDQRYNDNEVKDGHDVGLITLNPGKSITSPSKYIGLLAFENPKDSLNFTVTKAGYPATVRDVDSEISINAQYILRDENFDPLLRSPDEGGSALTGAQKLFSATGKIDEVSDNGVLAFSDSLDLEKGESGSAIWTTLEGDEPRVMGVLSYQNLGLSTIGIPFFRGNFAASIDTDAYGKIVEKMKNRLAANSGNDLPENAIIGSSDSSNIVGSYRKERILGNEGQDTISGGEADDRLEGGIGNDVLKGEKGKDRLQGDQGNDFLDGGDGNEDTAFFSDDFANYDYSISQDKTTITLAHNKGTQTDGIDTLKNIEYAEFKDGTQPLGNARLATDPAPRIIPLPLEDGVLDTEAVKATDTTVNPNFNDPPTPPYVSLTAPVAMLDGNVDYTLNISPYKPDTQYNILYFLDTSSTNTASASPNLLKFEQEKSAYIDLTNNLTSYFANQGLADNLNFGIVTFNNTVTLQTDPQGDRNFTAAEAIAKIKSLTATTSIGRDYQQLLNI